ncbi:ABC transporter ATP-binding protein [Geovibrio thiophilus]|uniref:ABC transporter ATP-binding protein n=1 Tax=Geovibrio thiophilus TaxID=139438 RepID=A0A410JZ39_9BACT|nr:ABC transporter ATP-binding protein [Geovibrio thiophilus]QAR33437.1 ABC transporter ATP-binding protein [Geovibrio thiophilus]
MNKITVRSLTKLFGGQTAVDGISFDVEEGSVLALLGPNGAGKTTTINMLTGLTIPASGEIRYDGEEFDPQNKRIKRTIGVVPQHNNVDRDLTVYQNLKTHAVLFGVDRAEERIAQALDFSGLSAHAGKTAGNLSGGMKRRLIIARALLHDPFVLFLDEPTVGLDASVRRTMWDFIRSINQEKQCTILLTTHYIEEAELLSDRVMIMDKARIVAEGTAAELKARVGKWALDIYRNGRTETEFFETREAGLKRLASLTETASIRETNLEDVYLTITGRRIDA